MVKLFIERQIHLLKVLYKLFYRNIITKRFQFQLYFVKIKQKAIVIMQSTYTVLIFKFCCYVLPWSTSIMTHYV